MMRYRQAFGRDRAQIDQLGAAAEPAAGFLQLFSESNPTAAAEFAEALPGRMLEGRGGLPSGFARQQGEAPQRRVDEGCGFDAASHGRLMAVPAVRPRPGEAQPRSL